MQSHYNATTPPVKRSEGQTDESISDVPSTPLINQSASSPTSISKLISTSWLTPLLVVAVTTLSFGLGIAALCTGGSVIIQSGDTGIRIEGQSRH